MRKIDAESHGDLVFAVRMLGSPGSLASAMKGFRKCGAGKSGRKPDAGEASH